MKIPFSWHWAMPSKNTFDVPVIARFVEKYMQGVGVSVDPFARNKRLATYTNDLNPKTKAQYHMDAEDFLKMLAEKGVRADLVIFDPPYSPVQMSRTYQLVKSERDWSGTHNGALYRRVRNAIMPICKVGTIVCSFGWNSAGMGARHGFDRIEMMVVCHGGGHNDTICVAERRRRGLGFWNLKGAE